ncbi:MAG: class F420-dependent oxidoreductase [Naasia sp.]|jgi:probable non-F420 flavinoid oxidoreductase|uniref:TIGR03885 family FMN-dependent LLM class oxidoreductase n=1 Tax=Naasia sp. TaxID=2546198 RepID=UPI00262EA735|nr:TIGR03885 family FMN-dependent LLM class oxidoreductase [Naasia sp.]MCU1571230.1 class F420-dependent oxidoreductase [Naasia sp.]
MTVLGFHASHEQIPPGDLLRAVQQAEEVGFGAAMCSDHVAPWSERQGESGFAWSWLGAAMQATTIPFGVVNAPGQRYSPVMIAQAAATLESMYPGRLWVALGSGENVNEHITGDPWPPKDVRNARLRECADIIRALFAGEEVTHHGLVTVDRARLWTRPDSPPPFLGAAVSEETARWLGGWTDGLITIYQPGDALPRMLEAYREAGGGGRLVLQVHLSYAPDERDALELAHDQWRTNSLKPPTTWDLAMPSEFDEATAEVQPDDLRSSVLISSDPGRFVDWLGDLLPLGFDEIHLHHVGRHQDEFLDVFGERVLPQLALGGFR